MEHDLDGQGWVLEVQVTLLHLLKYVREDAVHQEGKSSHTACLAELVISFQLHYPVSQVYYELVEKLLRILAKVIFELQ